MSAILSEPPDKEVMELVVCASHDRRLLRGDPCIDCPSKPENMERAKERAKMYDLNYRATLISSNLVHTNLLEEIKEAMIKLSKTVLNVYLIIASCLVITLNAFLLWNLKIEEKTFVFVLFVCLFPWYGTGVEKITRLIRGDSPKT